jgi:hypothetical protein
MTAGFMGFDLKGHKATIYNDGNAVWSTTTFATIGLAVKNAMLIPETANKYIFIDSFTVSQNQVLASFGKTTGKSGRRYMLTPKNRRKSGWRRWPRATSAEQCC